MTIRVALMLLSMNQYFVIPQRRLTHSFILLNIENVLILVQVITSIYQSSSHVNYSFFSFTNSNFSYKWICTLGEHHLLDKT